MLSVWPSSPWRSACSWNGWWPILLLIPVSIAVRALVIAPEGGISFGAFRGASYMDSPRPVRPMGVRRELLDP